MLVRWTQPAADDLLHICDYTAERFGAAQARRVADAIYETSILFTYRLCARVSASQSVRNASTFTSALDAS